MLSCAIDARERHGVATVDILGVFVQTGMEGDIVYMKLEGTMPDIFSKLDPKLYQ